MGERPPEIEMYGQPIPDYTDAEAHIVFRGCRLLTTDEERQAMDEWWDQRRAFEAQFQVKR